MLELEFGSAGSLIKFEFRCLRGLVLGLCESLLVLRSQHDSSSLSPVVSCTIYNFLYPLHMCYVLALTYPHIETPIVVSCSQRQGEEELPQLEVQRLSVYHKVVPVVG